MSQAKSVILVSLFLLPNVLSSQEIIELQKIENIKSITVESKKILDSIWKTSKNRILEYDKLGQLLSDDISRIEGDMQLYRFKYDEQGNMTQINTYRNHLDSLSSSINYIYGDKGNRLSSSSFYHNYSTTFYVDSEATEVSIWSTTYTKSKFTYNRKGLLTKTIRLSTFTDLKPSKNNGRYKTINKKPNERFRVLSIRKFNYNKMGELLKTFTKSTIPKYTATQEFNYVNDTILQNSIYQFTGNSNSTKLEVFNNLGNLETVDEKYSDSSKNRFVEYIYNDQNMLVKEKYTLGPNSPFSIQGLHYEFDNQKNIDVVYYYNDLNLIERIEHYTDSRVIGKIECKYELYK